MIKFSKSTVLLFLILIFSFTLSLWHLGTNPAGFFCDEANIGYNAYTILKYGKDEYGISFPIFFRSFGDFRAPIKIYSTVPFVALFGLSEISTRLPSVLYGLIIIVFAYLLGIEIFSKNFGLLVAFTLSTMPWFIHYNRVGFEFVTYSAFFVTTLFLFIKAARNKLFIIPAFTIAAVTLYSYQPPKLIIPLLIIGILIIYGKKYILHKKETVVGVISFCILSVPLILSFINGEAVARFNLISVFSSELPLPQLLSLIATNYLIQLSPFYFISGEPTFITRHFSGGLLPLLQITLPFIILGLIYTLLIIKNKISQIIIFLLIIYPLAGAVTASGPFTARSIIGTCLFSILICLGITVLIKKLKHYIFYHLFVVCFVSLFVINFASFSSFYFTKYPLYSSDFWGWQYGPREIMKYFLSEKDRYDDLYMSGEFNAGGIFLNFYDPENTCNSKCKIGDFYREPSIYNKERKQLFSLSPEYLRQSAYNNRFKIKKTVYYPNGQIAFIIGEIY